MPTNHAPVYATRSDICRPPEILQPVEGSTQQTVGGGDAGPGSQGTDTHWIHSLNANTNQHDIKLMIQ
eukprot:1161704-Pelagomonas_calceolata.AAC.6